jgi:hypothetical protein
MPPEQGSEDRMEPVIQFDSLPRLPSLVRLSVGELQPYMLRICPSVALERLFLFNSLKFKLGGVELLTPVRAALIIPPSPA